MPQPFHSPLEQYGVAILSVLVAILLRMALNPLLHTRGDIELKFSVANEQGRLEISDNGPGFPPDFDP